MRIEDIIKVIEQDCPEGWDRPMRGDSYRWYGWRTSKLRPWAVVSLRTKGVPETCRADATRVFNEIANFAKSGRYEPLDPIAFQFFTDSDAPHYTNRWRTDSVTKGLTPNFTDWIATGGERKIAVCHASWSRDSFPLRWAEDLVGLLDRRRETRVIFLLHPDPGGRAPGAFIHGHPFLPAAIHMEDIPEHVNPFEYTDDEWRGLKR